MLQKGQLDIDHIDPLAEEGLDAENNFALTHQSCNRSKGAANLQVARRIKEFERLQEEAKDSGKRGANLDDVLAQWPDVVVYSTGSFMRDTANDVLAVASAGAPQ